MPTHRILVAALLTMLPASTFAYIDPNGAGMLFQLLAPIFAALVGGFVFARRWIGSFLRRTWARFFHRDPG